MKTLIVAGACALAMTAATPAQAHTLLPRDAANDAWLAADDWAEENQWRYHADADTFDVTFPRSRCYRQSRHVQECDGGVEFEQWHYGTYSDFTTTTYCAVTVRVRLTSWDTRTKVRKRWCG